LSIIPRAGGDSSKNKALYCDLAQQACGTAPISAGPRPNLHIKIIAKT